MAESDKKVSAMVAAQTMTTGALMYVAEENQSSASGYESFKISAGDAAQAMLNAFSFPLLLNTTAKNVLGAINELKSTADDGAIVLLGTAAPASNAGVDGNIYVRYSTAGNVTTITNMYVKISGAWSEVSTGGGSSTLAGLTDVDITTPSDGQALLYDAQNSKWINGSAGSGSAPRKIYVGTCDTAAATAQKSVTVSADQNFVLEVGATVKVKFTNSNSATNVTISVNGTSAYPIWFSNSQYTGSTVGVTGQQNCNLTYVFDGSYWCWLSMGKYQSYLSMTDAEAEAGTSTANRVISPAVLKHAIQYHAIPQDDNTERVVGTSPIDGSVIYEKTFGFAYIDMQGGTQDATRINGVFVLDSNVNYKNIYIVNAQVINLQPDSNFNVWSMPIPIASANGLYSRVQIQKSYSNPAAYDGVPFIYFDTTYNASQIFNNQNDFWFIFTIRYTKASS